MMNSDILSAVANSVIDDRIRPAAPRPASRPFWKRGRRDGGSGVTAPAAAPSAAPAETVTADRTEIEETREERVLTARR